jgi:hypothetical protein
MKENGDARAVERVGEKRKAQRALVRKSEETRPLERIWKK